MTCTPPPKLRHDHHTETARRTGNRSAVTEYADWGPLRGLDPHHQRRSTRNLTEQLTTLKQQTINYLLTA